MVAHIRKCNEKAPNRVLVKANVWGVNDPNKAVINVSPRSPRANGRALPVRDAAVTARGQPGCARDVACSHPSCLQSRHLHRKAVFRLFLSDRHA